MRFLLRITICLLLVFVSVNTYASNSCSQDVDKCTQYFHRSPNLSDLSQIIDAANANGSKQPLQSFVTLAIYKNPDIAKQTVIQFQHFSPKAKQLFLNALLANKINFKELSKKYNLTPEKTLSPGEINNLDINDDAANLDTLWSAYEATGNMIYPKKILGFISNNDNYLFMASFYFVNGVQACPPASLKSDSCPWLPIKKMKHDLESRYPNQAKTIFHHMVVLSSALWSMNAMRKQDKQFNEKIFILCREKPELDYLKKIFPDNKEGYWRTVPVQSGNF